MQKVTVIIGENSIVKFTSLKGMNKFKNLLVTMGFGKEYSEAYNDSKLTINLGLEKEISDKSDLAKSGMFLAFLESLKSMHSQNFYNISHISFKYFSNFDKNNTIVLFDSDRDYEVDKFENQDIQEDIRYFINLEFDYERKLDDSLFKFEKDSFIQFYEHEEYMKFKRLLKREGQIINESWSNIKSNERFFYDHLNLIKFPDIEAPFYYVIQHLFNDLDNDKLFNCDFKFKQITSNFEECDCSKSITQHFSKNQFHQENNEVKYRISVNSYNIADKLLSIVPAGSWSLNLLTGDFKKQPFYILPNLSIEQIEKVINMGRTSVDTFGDKVYITIHSR